MRSTKTGCGCLIPAVVSTENPSSSIKNTHPVRHNSGETEKKKNVPIKIFSLIHR